MNSYDNGYDRIQEVRDGISRRRMRAEAWRDAIAAAGLLMLVIVGFVAC